MHHDCCLLELAFCNRISVSWEANMHFEFISLHIASGCTENQNQFSCSCSSFHVFFSSLFHQAGPGSQQVWFKKGLRSQIPSLQCNSSTTFENRKPPEEHKYWSQTLILVVPHDLRNHVLLSIQIIASANTVIA